MAEKTVKVPNYTDEQAAKVAADYAAGIDPKVIAAELGKTARSVIAKLSRMGVYKPKAYATKNGEKPVKKDAHADAIGIACGLTDGEVDSLTKANKTALVKILSRLQDV